jgi:hypothetical protein
VTAPKRFFDALTAQGTVYDAAQAAGVSRNTAYRWRQEDHEFACLWDEANENAVDAVESVLYQSALGGNIVAIIFYLKAHRSIYRDKLNIDLKQVQSEIEEKIAQLRQRGDVLPLVNPSLPSERSPAMPGSRSFSE